LILIPAAAVSLMLGGPIGMLGAGTIWILWRWRSKLDRAPPFRPILMMMLVELRSGLSVLAALQSVASQFPEHHDLEVAVRLAGVAGMSTGMNASSGQVKVLLAHLARAQASGGSAADAVRRMLESGLAREKAARLARTRALPVQMMIPVSLLLLPGVVLLAYGPTLIALVRDLAVPFG
jgi:pilus assembly protein TadC